MNKIEFYCEECGSFSHKRKQLYDKESQHFCASCKRKKTNIERYGFENPFKSKEIQKNIRLKFKEKYGVDNPWNLKEIQEKCRKTQIDKYGVLFNVNKSIQTKLKKYNNPNYNNREKFKKTCIEKYGVDNPWKSEDIKEKIKETLSEKHGVSSMLKLKKVQDIATKVKRKNNFYRIISSKRLNNLVEALSNIDEYKSESQKLKWRCKKCDDEFYSSILNGSIPRCLKCFPYLSGESYYEKEIIKWLKKLNIELKIKNRKTIAPLELDIYIPSHNLAIEFDGLYWHSELQGKNSFYHLNKTNRCLEKGIQLLHIWENEWIEKQDIVKSIIKSKLGIYNTIIHGRKCRVEKISNEIASNFYFENHIQGSINSSINIGLYHNNELVSCLSFSKPRFNKKYDWEITRFANRLNTKVHGGFSKLWKNKPEGSVTTYSDKRLFTGVVYKKHMIQLSDSDPSYWYFKYKEFKSRIEFQKHKLNEKLKIFDSSLTEWENMQLNGYDRIWDCGHHVFEWRDVD